jgi:hypothetical protein
MRASVGEIGVRGAIPQQHNDRLRPPRGRHLRAREGYALLR